MTNEQFKTLIEWFGGYCRSFHSDNAEDQQNIGLKEDHCCRVRDIMRRLAGSEKLADEAVMRAEIIGLFHDVGRFTQYREFRTFRDPVSVNHAKRGVDVIREHRLLDPLNSIEAQTILSAVAHHNCIAIPEGLAGEQLLFLKLIRDADKLDIMRFFVGFYNLPENERPTAAGLGRPDTPGCSPAAFTAFLQGRMIDYASLTCLNDFKLLKLSWIYDLNFKESLRFVEEKGYINALAGSITGVAGIEDTVGKLQKYIRASLTEKGA